jgi:FtsP/CotA-like multicopper oxidase with cupredoxin domain
MREKKMKDIHIYLKIEPLRDYTPVAPDDAEHHKHRIDCMRTMDHEDGKIPPAEIDRRRLEGLVYREYLDADYTVLKTDPLIAADINEPAADRRIPGTVIYTQPGERLYIHVLNADEEPHSFHLHGLHYGIDSDGSWPFGTHRDDGNRSDAICPGKQWCYVFDVKEDSIGAWPFHDHHMHISEVVNRGLFGGLVVRDPHCEQPDLEVPIFFHRLAGKNDTSLFDSGSLNPGDTFSFTFPDEGTFEYYCKFHPMQGRVRVTTTGPATATVNILDTPPRFELDDVTIRAGGAVTWNHGGTQAHTVTDRTGAGLESLCINGRTFVGNTPTIVAESGKRIRWYVFNLDLGMMWHNFHLHGQRWKSGGEMLDTRSLGPAESFVADTVVPPVILWPLPLDCDCEPQKGHDEPQTHEAHTTAELKATHLSHQQTGESDSSKKPYPVRRKYKLQGDFLLHCHVEMHMMQGMAALVRAMQEVELTDHEVQKICFHLPKIRLQHCPDVDHHICDSGGKDSWELLTNSPIFIVHGALLANGRVLVFSGAAERNYPLQARIWNPATKLMTPPIIPLPEDFFCSGHTFLSDGRLLVIGGDTNGAGHTNNRCYFFTPDPVNPDTGSFTPTASMAHARWYPTALRLGDGRILAFSGNSPLAEEVEVFDGAGTWNSISGANRAFGELYPGMHLLPSSEIFNSHTGWSGAAGSQTAYLTLTGPMTGNWSDYGQQQFYDRQEGMSLLMIDTTVSPSRTRLFVFGGGVSGVATAKNNQSAEVIEFTGGIAGAGWKRLKDMNFARTNVNAVVLPDGKILIIGGHSNGQKWSPTPILPTEIYDPATDTYTTTAMLNFPRQYHSVCILLPDGRVFSAGGVAPGTADPDQHTMELYTPGYLTGASQPTITNVPATLTFGNPFTIDTPQAADIESIVLLATISVTHHTDSGQRYIKLPIQSRTASTLMSLAPANGNIAPPGFYMLFIVKNNGVPSEGRFIHLI